MVTLRARQVLLWLSELGLSHSQLIAALPRRAQIRTRLVLFTAIAVVTPALLTSNLASSLAERTYEEVLATPQEDQLSRLADLREGALFNGGVLCLLVFGLALTTAYLGGTLVGRPIRQLAEEARRIADGNLASPRLIPAEDEVWAVSAAFAMMRAHLADVLSQLQRAGAQIGATTEEILAPRAATRRAPPSRPARWTRRAPPRRSWPGARGRSRRTRARWRRSPSARWRRPRAGRAAPRPSWHP